jgi:uncharacterized YigZ family protein
LKIIYKGGSGEIVEKKSRFIATIRPVSSEEEATAFIAEMKKKYWDARHNCSAFVIGERNELSRCSDDGEPPQTAGRPMLDILLGEDIHDAAVVVTRYFGGVLLGTGGLVRAYQGAVRAGLENCVIADRRSGRMMKIMTDYNGLGKLQYVMAQNDWSISDTVYTDKVEMTAVIPSDEVSHAETEVTEATGGSAVIEWGEEVSYGMVGKEQLIF